MCKEGEHGFDLYWHQCGRKKQLTKSEARFAIAEAADVGVKLHRYGCPFGVHFHIGHGRRSKRRQHKGRAQYCAGD